LVCFTTNVECRFMRKFLFFKKPRVDFHFKRSWKNKIWNK
jgi:hypothetical protein